LRIAKDNPGELPKIREGIKNYLQFLDLPENDYLSQQHLSTFLNQERWKSEFPGVKNQPKKPKPLKIVLRP
jgi:hypothetical protein